MRNTTPRLSIVLPAFCEATHLENSLAVIRASVGELGVTYEIVVVDDGSPDNTWPILQDLSRRWPEMQAFRLARNFGKEGCLLAGLEASRGDAVIIMDADLQHPPALIGKLYRLWADEGYEIVNAVKAERGDESWLKRRLTRIYYRLFARLTGVKIGDSSDFKLLSRRVVEAYCSLPERNVFFRGLVNWMGFRQTNVAFNVAARAGGATSWSYFKLAKFAINAIVSFSTIPLQAVTLLGVAFLIFGAVLAGQTIWLKLAGEAIEGFTTVILLLLLIGAVLMIALGIIGQYVAKIFDEVKRRPRYLIRDQAESHSDPIDPANDTDQKARRIAEKDPVA